MSELMQFTICYFILDQTNNDNYKMQCKSVAVQEKRIQCKRQKKRVEDEEEQINSNCARLLNTRTPTHT